jgi:hypothetical protein
MNERVLKKLLEEFRLGRRSLDEVVGKLKTLPFEDLGFANIDHHRSLRSGIPEVIYCAGKSPEQILTLIGKMNKAGSDVLATRLVPETYRKLRSRLPKKAKYHPLSRLLVIRNGPTQRKLGLIAVVTAGTSDIPVAEEAALTAELLGSHVETIYDVGVAGLHRLLKKLDRLRMARVVVAVAGMDGALPSVLGGLLDAPLIAVPTSIGYGTAFGGIAPLLTMLNSCSAGAGVVNIDNGFGAGCLAHKINRLGGDAEIL